MTAVFGPHHGMYISIEFASASEKIRFFEILSTLFEGKYAESCATTQHEFFSSIFFSACYDSDFSTVARCLNQKSKAAIEYLNSIGVDLCQHDCSGQMVQESWLKEQIHNALSTTVVVTSYNQEKFIQDCLRSIISQRGVPFNIVLGDDCSSDETVRRAEAVLREAGAEYSILRQAVNAGMLNNLKRSLESASGKYIAICEGDDYWLSDRRLLKHILTLACNQDVGMTFNWILVDDEIRNVNYAHPQQATLRDGEILDSWQLLQDNVIGNFSACVYRSEVVREIPISYWSKAGAADWLFNIMITANKRAEFVRELLSVYRLHRSGQWSSLSPMERETAVSVARHEYSDLIGFDYDEMRNFLKLKFEFVCFHALSPPLVGVIDEVKPIYGSASDHRFAVCISGWVFSDCGEQLSLTVVGAGTCHDVSLSIERPDVVIHHAFEGDAVCSTLLCGFSFELPSNNIPINIFVKNGTDEVLWGAIRCISVDTLK
jgi:glycosyltransferase involved in cell wall biosynthesis